MSSVRSTIKSTYAIGSTSQPNPALVSGDMSADIIGPVTQIDKIDQVAYQVSWVGPDAVGIISVQGSIDGVNFINLTFNPPLAQPASDNNSYLINLALLPFPLIRLKYTRTSGSASLMVYLSAKGN